MIDPPLEAGAVKATLALEGPVFVATPTVGAPGTIESVVTEFEIAEAAEIPTLLVAVTEKVYAVAAFRPLTVIVPEVAWLRLPVNPPGLAVAV